MGTPLQFGILGPLEVLRDGVVVAIGGPRQRALLALLLCNANRVLSRDRLIDELLADESARSPERTLRVQVSRLRKALADDGDERRLEARSPGYLLRVDDGELDLHAFERLAAEGRAALEHDDSARAAQLLREAEGLWRGRPLADLEFEPFARFEVQRLEELRLLALEDRFDAELALGHHAALCPELATLTSEYPLRERLRGQLMLALYRSDRQADALAVYRQTSDLLREELGLDPSRTLRELERSILEQDFSLDAGARVSTAVRDDGPATCPFKGLEFFDRADAGHFFGRERVVAELLARTADSSLVGILGPSGIGKSSLLRAGVLAALSAGELPGSAGWRQVVLRPGEEPCRQLAGALGAEDPGAVLAQLAPGERLVVAVDQLEELFTTCEREDERALFLERLLAAARDDQRRALVVVALRGDYYARFAPYSGFADLLSSGHVLVGPMDRDELASAIEAPAAQAGLEVERPLIDALVADAAAQTGGLPLLSAMLLELWGARDGRVLRYESYRSSGGMHAAVARLAESAYARLAKPQREVAQSVMLRLATEQDGALVRRRAPVAELERINGANPVVAALIDARLLTLSDGRIELSHEALLREWPRYRTWLEEDRAGRRLHAHLTSAAEEWETGDRDPGELYRGARLVAAVDWAGQHGDRLNSLESAFLDAGRLESQHEQRRQRSQNRRLRVLLIAVGALLAVAVGAAIVAAIKQETASNEARAALARQLGAEAVNEPRLDVAMLMAREAVRLDRSPQTEGTLLATLLRSPAVIGTIALPGNTTGKLAFSPDGRTLAIADSLGELRLYDPRTHKATAAPLGELAENQTPVYSDDGTLLAYRTTECQCGLGAGIAVRDARTLVPVVTVPTPIAPGDIPGGSIAIAPNDGAVYYAYWVSPRAGAPAEAYLRRWTLPNGRALGTVRIGSGPLLAMRLVDAGSRVVIVTRRSLRVFEARSLRLLRTRAITRAPAAPAAAAISPDGRTVVIGSRAGVVSFFDADTGRARSSTDAHNAAVSSIVYTPDGRTLATVDSDDTVIGWNPRTETPDEVLTGPPGGVAGAALSPDGSTLYTSSLDGVLLEWDLSGGRSFGSRSRLGAASRCCDPVAPPGAPLALSPDGTRFAARVAPSTVGLFSTRTLQRLASFTIGHDGIGVTALAWSPGGAELAVGGHSGNVQLWSTDGTPRLFRSLAGLRSILGQPEAVQAIAFSPNGSVVAASDDDEIGSSAGGSASADHASLAIWQSATGRLLALPNLSTNLDNTAGPAGDDLLAFSPNGKLVAMSMFDRSILVLGVPTGQVRQVLSSPAGSSSLAFAPDGTLATGTPAGTVELWNPITGTEAGAPLVVAGTAVTSLAIAPTGQSFVTTGLGEGSVKLWFTAALHQQGLAFNTDQGATASVAFERGGSRLLAVDDRGNGFSWPTAVSDWEARACAVAGRNPTPQEWSALGIGHAYSNVCP